MAYIPISTKLDSCMVSRIVVSLNHTAIQIIDETQYSKHTDDNSNAPVPSNTEVPRSVTISPLASATLQCLTLFQCLAQMRILYSYTFKSISEIGQIGAEKEI